MSKKVKSELIECCTTTKLCSKSASNCSESQKQNCIKFEKIRKKFS